MAEVDAPQRETLDTEAMDRGVGFLGLLWASEGSIIGSGWLFGAVGRPPSSAGSATSPSCNVATPSRPGRRPARPGSSPCESREPSATRSLLAPGMALCRFR